MLFKILQQQKWVLPMLIIGAVSLQSRAQNVVDATTMNNKVMAGYQGWFREPSDPLGDHGWHHTFNINAKWPAPSPESLAFDTWPDMSEYSAKEKYAVPGFTNPDGSQAYLYSAQNYKTVLRHFQWMKQYGIDGVWLSEFCGHFPGGDQEKDTTFRLKVMHNVKAAAAATGRTWAFMWDMSGFGPRMSKQAVYNIIVNQWKKMVDEGITSDPHYLHQNGKPVLLIWGFFPNRPASQPDYMKPVVDFIQAPGKYQCALVGGVETKWRTQGTPEFLAMLATMTAIQPWSVGRAIKDPATGYKMENMDTWAGDIEWCKAHNIIFQPVLNSGTHIAGPPPPPAKGPIVPRRTGNYLWEQFVQASKTGVINGAFIAMFDEVNEGTQILKISNKPPTQAPFLTYDGATSDYYLRLVGTAAKMLKNNTPIAFPIPISPFDAKKLYTIKNIASGMMLHSTGKNTTSAIVQAGNGGAEWQLLFDDNGYFVIKNRASGKVLSAGELNTPVTQAADTKADNQKWHLEWDGTGNCRIVSKNGKVALASNSADANAAITQTADAAGTDNLRWQITEQ
ncbi:MAG TPA: RICIN domain-containing protein [Mucilaginibacter sp.]|jgi:hypothetical protein|nr:RICIN domain-containing protein [Mucilaginibacter sp.]